MPRSTLEVSCYKRRKIGHAAHCIHPQYVIQSIDGCSQQYTYTHIQLHPTSYSCGFLLYRQCLHVHRGWYVWWLHQQRRAGSTGDCVLAVCQGVTYWKKSPLIGVLRICRHLAEVVVYPWFGGVEEGRKMTKKRSGKTWGICSEVHVIME